jgi:hypothetical protein
MLHPVTIDVPSTLYCGPTAISSITGFPPSKVIKMIRRVRADHERKYYGRVLHGGRVKRIDGRRMPVKGTSNGEVLEVLRRAGFKPTKKGSPDKTSLRQFCDDYGHTGPFLVEVTGHYVTVSHGMICDTRTGYTPIPFAEYKKLRWMVKRWWKF